MTTAPQAPHSKTTNPTPRVDVVLCALLRTEQDCVQVLVARRTLESEILPGAWELPGGKIAPGESARDAAARELLEEVAVDCTDTVHEWQNLGVVEPPPPDGRPAPRFHVLSVQLPSDAVPKAIVARSIAWVHVKSLACIDWPDTTRPAVDAVVAAHGR